MLRAIAYATYLKKCEMPMESVANACRAYLMTTPVESSLKLQETILERLKGEDEDEYVVTMLTELQLASTSISFDTLFVWIRDIVPAHKKNTRILEGVCVLGEIYMKTNGEKKLVDVATYLLDRIESNVSNVDRTHSLLTLCKLLEAFKKCNTEKQTETECFVLNRSVSFLMSLLQECDSNMHLQRVILIDLLPNLFTIRNGEDATHRKSVANMFVKKILTAMTTTQKDEDYRLRHTYMWNLSLNCSIVCGVLLVMSKCSSFDLKLCCPDDDVLWRIVSIGLLVLPRSLTRKIVAAQEKRSIMLLRLIIETYKLKISSSDVEEFVDILTSLNANDSHLIKAVTKRMFMFCSKKEMELKNKIPIYTKEILLSKLFNHSNPTNRKFGVQSLLGSEKENLETEDVRKQLRPEYVSGRFLAMIDDGFFYRSKRGVVFKKMMCTFLSQYFDDLRRDQDEKKFNTFANEFVRSCCACMSAPNLQNLFSFLSKSNSMSGVLLDKNTLISLCVFMKKIGTTYGIDFVQSRYHDISEMLRKCSCRAVASDEFARVLSCLEDDIFVIESNKFRTWCLDACVSLKTLLKTRLEQYLFSGKFVGENVCLSRVVALLPHESRQEIMKSVVDFLNLAYSHPYKNKLVVKSHLLFLTSCFGIHTLFPSLKQLKMDGLYSYLEAKLEEGFLEEYDEEEWNTAMNLFEAIPPNTQDNDKKMYKIVMELAMKHLSSEAIKYFNAMRLARTCMISLETTLSNENFETMFRGIISPPSNIPHSIRDKMFECRLYALEAMTRGVIKNKNTLSLQKRILDMSEKTLSVSGGKSRPVSSVLRTVAMTLPSILEQQQQHEEKNHEENVRKRVSGIIQSAQMIMKECIRSVKVELIYAAFADMAFHPKLLSCSILNESHDSPVRAAFREHVASMRQKPSRVQARLARYCTVRFLSAFVGKASIGLEHLEPYVNDLAAVIANNEFENASSSEDEPPRPQTVSRFIVTSFVRAMIESETKNSKKSVKKRLITRKIIRRLLYESTSKFHEKLPKDQTTQGYRHRFHLRDIRIWQALACLSKGMRCWDSKFRQDMLQETMNLLIQKHHHAEVRYHAEMYAILLIVEEPEFGIDNLLFSLLKSETDKKTLSSVLIISIAALRFILNRDNHQQHHDRVLRLGILCVPLINHVDGLVRVLAQYVVLVLHSDTDFDSIQDEHVQDLGALLTLRHVVSYLKVNEKIMTMYQRNCRLFKKFDPSKWTKCPMELLGRGLGYRVGPHDYVSDPKEDDDLVFEYNVEGEIISEAMAVRLENCMWDVYHELEKGEKEEEEGKKDGDDDDVKQHEDTTIRQQKIEPWSNLLGFESHLSRQDEVSRRRRQDIIVVASLVDKAPNLGGLSRTCEIFRAKKLILPNLKFAKDKVFRSVSVGAEKWLPIEQVLKRDLPEYLRMMSKAGWKIVGLEQSNRSTRLENFNFPEKVVLLLGEEKFGIPGNLLSLLDFCVEIPQLGLIRSLNVHVSGSILLWEYTKQKYLSSDSD